MSTLVERLGDAMVAHVQQVLRDHGISDETIANDPEIASSTREVIEALYARLTPPAEVVRYTPEIDGILEPKPDPEGEWVRYEDHAAALTASEAKRKEAEGVLRAYERWEADLIEDDRAWGLADGMFVPQDMYDRMIVIQTARNAALDQPKTEDAA